MTFTFDDPLLKMGVILFAGIVGGELVGRIRLPKVTGWIGTGIILTALPLAFLDTDAVLSFTPFMNFVLGYIAFTVGAALHFASLKTTSSLKPKYAVVAVASIRPSSGTSATSSQPSSAAALAQRLKTFAWS